MSCLGSNERNPPEAEAREGRASGSERVKGKMKTGTKQLLLVWPILPCWVLLPEYHDGTSLFESNNPIPTDKLPWIAPNCSRLRRIDRGDGAQAKNSSSPGVIKSRCRFDSFSPSSSSSSLSSSSSSSSSSTFHYFGGTRTNHRHHPLIITPRWHSLPEKSFRDESS